MDNCERDSISSDTKGQSQHHGRGKTLVMKQRPCPEPDVVNEVLQHASSPLTM